MENFEKLKLSATYGSEPHQLDYLYDMQTRNIKRAEFFTSNVNIDKTHWFYLDKYEDVSIYYFKSEGSTELTVNTSLTNLNQSQSTAVAGSATPSSSMADASSTNSGNGAVSSANAKVRSANSIEETSPSLSPLISAVPVSSATLPSTVTATATSTAASASASLFIPQKNESFNDKLKLWKCCTLVKHPGLTLEKIVHRIKYERYFLLKLNFNLLHIINMC